MRVFVAGGTGAVGRFAVPALVDAGHSVTALARTPAKSDALRAQGASAATVSLFDADALAAAFAGHDTVVNLASNLPSMARFMSTAARRNNHRVRADGSAAIVDAAIAAGVGSLVQESVSMLYPDHGAAWVDEDTAPDRYPATKGNLAAEDNAARFAAQGGTAVVVRFGLFYGQGAAHSEQMFAMARFGIATMLGPPHGFLSSIHTTDAGAAVAAALHAPPGTYNVVDDEPLTKREYADAMARAAGARWWLRAPGRLALLFGDRLTSLTRSLRVSNARFRAATGWAPRYPSATDGWAATAEALRNR